MTLGGRGKPRFHDSTIPHPEETMQTEVVMPQMGESVTEGTVTTWFKEIGEYVERDEALLEITTDKVDAEVPSPSEGVLIERLVEPGETVEVGVVIAVVDRDAEEGEVPDVEIDVEAAGDGGDEEAAATRTDDEEPSDEPAGAGSGGADDRSAAAPDSSRAIEHSSAGRAGPPAGRSATAGAESGSTSGASHREGSDGEFPTKERLRRTRSTPLVRRIAAEHGIDDLTRIEGSGLSGRVTKEDIREYIDQGKHRQPQAADPAKPGAAEPTAREPLDREIERPDVEIGERDRVEAMEPQRQMIAEHMVRSRRVSPHAHTVHEVDFSRVVEDREERREAFAERDVDLTYTAYLVRAATEALLEHPMVNASLDRDEEHIIYRGDINVGMAVALERKLMVPVIENADELSLLGIARRVNDLAERARRKQLKTDEVEGGTFTISNHGVFGPEFGIPIINQPEAAILSTGAIKKRVVVDQETEAIEIRPTSIWCLSFDHRVIDGATADRFMRTMRNIIEEWSI